MFTQGQAKRIRAVFAHGNIRNGFLNSFACDSTSAQAAPLPDTTIPVVPVVNALAETRIYPNPVQTTMTIQLKDFSIGGAINLRIFNAVGVLVYTKQLAAGRTTHNLVNLARDTYLVQVADGKNTFNSRIIKF